MKATVINKFGDPNVFEFTDIPILEIQSNEVLVETVSASVNPIDWKQRKGNHKFIFGSPFPIVLGYDIAGTIIKTGSDITKFKVGDKVCGVLNNKYGGGLAQFVKGKENCFTIVPEGIDHQHSAAVPLAGLTALQALRDKGKIKSPHKVLIIGAAGGVGYYTVQIALIYGAKVTALTSARHKELFNNMPITEFIDYEITDILKCGKKYDIVFDCVGKYSFITCKHILEPKGIYINTLPRPKILLHKLYSLFANGKKVKTLLMKHSSSDLKLVISWVVSGKLKIHIDKEYSIYQIAEAHKYSELGHTQGKILILNNW